MRNLFALPLFLFFVSCMAGPVLDGTPYVMLPRDVSSFTNQFLNSVCYSGFRNGQSPESDPVVYPGYSQIREDLLILAKNWKVIRTYSSGQDTETALQVIRNEAIGLKMILGVWIGPYDCSAQIADGIRLANQYPDIVIALIVGCEALFSGSDHKVSEATMVSYVRQVRRGVVQPVTVSDVFDYWLLSDAPRVAAEIDFIMVHLYPLWWGQTLGNATSFTTNNYNAVRGAYPGKAVVIGEAGWATRSVNTYMITNEANEENQDLYYRRIVEWSSNNNVMTCFFQAFDEDWKHSFSYYDPADPEKNWGLFMTNRKAKLAMYGLYPELVDPSHVPSSN